MMKVVHSGIDTLDVAFQGALRLADVETLQAAKDKAAETRGTALTKIGPGAVEVAVYGYGTQTGYSFIIDTGPDGEIWTFNKNTNPQNWNLRVSIKARTLAILGYDGGKQQLLDRLSNFGCTIIKESISRADFAVDIQAPGYEVDLDLVIASPRSKVEPYWGDDDIPTEGHEASAVFRGRRLTGFRVGAIKQRQVVMYDKRKAAMEKRERHWFKIWDIDPAHPDSLVWRIEARIGKKEQRDRYAIVTFEDFEAGYGDAVVKALTDTRLASPDSKDSNLSRRAPAPIWAMAQQQAEKHLFDFRSGLTRNQIRAMDREEKLKIYRQQILGNSAGYAAWLGLDESELEAAFPQMMADEIRGALNNPEGRYHAAYRKATERYRFQANTTTDRPYVSNN